MDLADRLARRKGRREDLAAIAGLLAFLAAILAIVILPGSWCRAPPPSAYLPSRRRG
ncbi:hypothetical protein ROTAS13_04653 [Roseomonas sp. TAS13]|uniref:hypothetical protein n=1 Tax=Roseomonas TaxID=125216 RepID=UPI00095E162C|nr:MULTISPECIES: hypothetical protein [Roseomonas]MCG7354234.1 hypothetical protein [Roseomonas mucosa]GAV36963.1 hypothetical protein ROTAS13_04653 [Roseomonas sp. TAS13]